MHDEPSALAEIEGLSLNARNHLSHVLRNHLMVIQACFELGALVRVKEELKDLEVELVRMGL